MSFQTLYTCDHCGNKWRPRSPKPGDTIFCPKCGNFHSKRAEYKDPPKPRVYLNFEPVKKPPKSRPLKPTIKKRYYQKGLKK